VASTHQTWATHAQFLKVPSGSFRLDLTIPYHEKSPESSLDLAEKVKQRTPLQAVGIAI